MTRSYPTDHRTVITQTTETSAAATLINAIFASTSDAVLTEVLSDANNGNQVIGKIIAISTLPAEEKEMMIAATRRVLPGVKASSTPPYRLLLEAVGLPVPTGPMNASPYGGRGWQQPRHHSHPGHSPQNVPQGMSPGYGYGYPAYHHLPHGGSPTPPPGVNYSQMGQNLSPLLVPQNMSLGHSMRNGSPGPNMGSPRTPQARQRGRLSPGAHMMSPGSDPFNPVSG